MSLPTQSLSHVALLTSDLPRALAFYREFVGLHTVYETEHSVMLRVKEGEGLDSCGIVLFEPDEGDAPAGGKGAVHHLGFHVAGREEVDECARKGRESGLKVQGPIADDYIGYFCLVWDPDGNRLEFSAPEGVNRF